MPKAAPVPDLLDDIFDAEQFSQENLAGSILWLPLAKIYDNPYQTRADYDADHIQRLADNIWSLRDELPETHGLQQPPVARVIEFTTDGDTRIADRSVYIIAASVRKLARGERSGVQLHFGHNRLRAWRLLRNRDNERYARFPVLLAYADDRSMWRHAVAENAQRKDITAIEEALSITQAMAAFAMTQEQAGEPFGYAKTTVSNKLRLLDLPDAARKLLQVGAISERHGRELLRVIKAPSLLDALLQKPGELTHMSVRQLSDQIDDMIARCQPIAPQPRTGYLREGYGHNNPLVTRQYDPPLWPLDWTPVASDAAIVGACIGCRFYAHFGGEAGPRCTQQASINACYEVKTKRWNVEQAEAQAAAVTAVTATPTPAPASAASTTASGLPALAIPIKAANAGARITTEERIETQWFNRRDHITAPAALVERGLCSSDRCECFVLAYHSQAHADHLRPDPEHAPNMCYGCTSRQRLANRRTEMEHGDVQAHRKRIKAEDDEAERLLLAWLESARADDIWHNPAFLRSLVVHGMDIYRSHEGRDWDTHTLQERLFVGVAAKRCKTWAANVPHWALDKVRAWLADLDSAIGRAELPVPQFDARIEAVSEPLAAADLTVMRLVPLATYTDDDERNHQCLMSEWDGASWQSLEKLMRRCAYDDDPPCTITPAVVRHIAQDCTVAGVRRDMLALAEWLETVAELDAEVPA